MRNGQEWVFIFVYSRSCFCVGLSINTGTCGQIPSETLPSTRCLVAGFGETSSPSSLASPTHHTQLEPFMANWPWLCLVQNSSLYAKSNCKDYLEMKHLGVGMSGVKNVQRDSCSCIRSCASLKGIVMINLHVPLGPRAFQRLPLSEVDNEPIA